jgi:hypothetical protein
MSRYALEELTDDTLLDGLHSIVEKDRQTTADLLAHMGEVARRRLFYPMGYHSMQAYCVKVLHLSESAASKRVQVARKGWLQPVIFEAIADGRVHLSGMTLLVPFIDEENVHDLIAAATHRTKAEIELILAERFPKPTPAEGIEELNVKDVNAPGHLRARSAVKPMAPGQYLVQYGANEYQEERLQYARQLMSHRNPTGNLNILHMAGLELLIELLEKEIFGATDSPRENSGSSSGRHVPASVRRAVVERDGWQCSYLSPSGRRCESKWMLEFDHIEEFARGGKPTVDNMRLLCGGHNQYAAECTYGWEFMEEKRRAANE